MKLFASFFMALFIGQVSSAAPGEISGTVTLGKGKTVPAGAVVFIAARPAAGGPPMAVAKIDSVKFPLDFKLGKDNAMMGGAFAGDVEITVRVSQAPNPMSRTPGDLFGTLKTKVGAEKVKVVLDQKI